MTRAAELVLEIALALVVVMVLVRRRAWRRVGFRRLSTVRDLRFYWVPLFPVLPVLPAALAALPRTAVADLALLVALAALVGFVEEVVFRGLLLRWLVPRGLWWAAVVSSLAFGVAHFVNLLVGDDLGATLVQVGYASALGFAFAAVALRTGVLWPLVIIHALMDVVGFLTVAETAPTGITGSDVVPPALYAVGFVVYGSLVLRAMRVGRGGGEATHVGRAPERPEETNQATLTRLRQQDAT